MRHIFTPSAVNDAAEAGVEDSACAHRAGFDGAVNGAATEVAAEFGTGGGDGVDFGVAGDILPAHFAIFAHSDNVAILDNTRAKWHVAARFREKRLLDGDFHELFVWGVHIECYYSGFGGGFQEGAGMFSGLQFRAFRAIMKGWQSQKNPAYFVEA